MDVRLKVHSPQNLKSNTSTPPVILFSNYIVCAQRLYSSLSFNRLRANNNPYEVCLPNMPSRHHVDFNGHVQILKIGPNNTLLPLRTYSIALHTVQDNKGQYLLVLFAYVGRGCSAIQNALPEFGGATYAFFHAILTSTGDGWYCG